MEENFLRSPPVGWPFYHEDCMPFSKSIPRHRRETIILGFYHLRTPPRLMRMEATLAFMCRQWTDTYACCLLRGNRGEWVMSRHNMAWKVREKVGWKRDCAVHRSLRFYILTLFFQYFIWKLCFNNLIESFKSDKILLVVSRINESLPKLWITYCVYFTKIPIVQLWT